MASQFVFILDSPSWKSLSALRPSIESLYSSEEKLSFSRHEGGVITIDYIARDIDFPIRTFTLIPDVLGESGDVVKFCEMRSPFSKLGQTGKYSIVALYFDGRIRVWDSDSGKCYLQSKEMAIKDPQSVEIWGSALHSRKRWIYYVRRGGVLGLFDLWGFKKAEMQLASRYEVVSSIAFEGGVALLDVDQKITWIDFSFLETAEFQKELSNVDNHNKRGVFQTNSPISHLIAGSSPQRPQNSNNSSPSPVITAITRISSSPPKFYFLPIRTTPRRFDDAVGLSTFRFDVFTQVFVVDKFFVLFSEKLIQVLKISDFLSNESVHNFETREDYSKQNTLLIASIEATRCTRSFLISSSKGAIFVLLDPEKGISTIPFELLNSAWIDSARFDGPPGPCVLKAKYGKKVEFSIQPYRLKGSPTDVHSVFEGRGGVFIEGSGGKSRVDLDTLIKENKEYFGLASGELVVSSRAETNKLDSILKRPTSISPSNFFENIFSRLSRPLSDSTSPSKLSSLLSSHFSSTDSIELETLASNSRDGQISLLLYTNDGNIISLPMFVDMETAPIIQICPLQVPNATHMMFVQDTLLLFDEETLRAVAWKPGPSGTEGTAINRGGPAGKIEGVEANDVGDGLESISPIRGGTKISPNTSTAQPLNTSTLAISISIIPSLPRYLPLRGRLLSALSIRGVSNSPIHPLTKRVLILQYETLSIQILLVPELTYILEECLGDSPLLAGVCDEGLGVLYLIF